MLLGESPKKQIFTLTDFHSQTIILFSHKSCFTVIFPCWQQWLYCSANIFIFGSGFVLRQQNGCIYNAFLMDVDWLQLSDSHRALLVLSRVLNESEPGSCLHASCLPWWNMLLFATILLFSSLGKRFPHSTHGYILLFSKLQWLAWNKSLHHWRFTALLAS